jgi:HSP20 family protein
MPEKSTEPSQTSKVNQAGRSAAQMEGAGQMETAGTKQEASAPQGSKQEGSAAQRGRPSSALQMRTSNAPLASPFGLSPFAIVRRLMEDMDRMLEEFGSGRSSGPEAGMGESFLQRAGLSPVWSPAIEAFECDGQFVVRADLPGLTPEEVTVETAGDALVIQGERQSELNVEEQGVYRAERSYGRFSRIIPLPEGADVDHASARFENGVLEVSVPLPELAQGRRRIEIQGASTGDQAKRPEGQAALH